MLSNQSPSLFSCPLLSSLLPSSPLLSRLLFPSKAGISQLKGDLGKETALGISVEQEMSHSRLQLKINVGMKLPHVEGRLHGLPGPEEEEIQESSGGEEKEEKEEKEEGRGRREGEGETHVR